MPHFSQKSLDRLNTCHPDLITLMNEVIKVYDCSIICGHRGKAEQDKAYEAGHSKLKYPKSNHNKKPSLAVDVYPYPIDMKDISRFKEMAEIILEIADDLYQRGDIDHEIQWGGAWKSFRDYPHFELIK